LPAFCGASSELIGSRYAHGETFVERQKNNQHWKSGPLLLFSFAVPPAKQF
jgi:hypothetical protein